MTPTVARPLHPRPLAWPLSALSVLALVTLFGLIDYGNSLVIQFTAREKLGTSLRNASDESVRGILATIAGARSSGSFFGLLVEPEEVLVRHDKIIEIALTLRAALIAEDTTQIQISVRDLEQEFLSSTQFDPSRAERLVNIQRLLREDLSAHQRSQTGIGKLVMQQAEIEDASIGLASRYQLIQGDLNELFSLNLKLRARIPDFAFYKSGALAELPQIHDLPDNLADYIVLREELERIGGRVRLEGDDANQVFANKIDQIRIQSREIAEAHSSAEKSLATIEEQLTESKNARRISRERLLNALGSLIIELSE